MVSINSSSKAWFNQIYLNLGNSPGNSPHHHKVEFSYIHLVEKTSVPYRIQVHLPESFREFLVHESGLHQYQVKNPLELAPELRTQRWQTLCDYLSDYSSLDKTTQINVIKLLSSLCLHQAVLDYIPPISEVEIANDSDSATLAFLRAMSDSVLHSDRYLPYDFKKFETIAKNAPTKHKVRIASGLQILVEFAKTVRDVEGAEFWRSTVRKEIQDILPFLDTFNAGLLMSIYYRAAVFIPLLKKDQAKVIAEMDICQSYAESLSGETPEQKIIAYENLSIIGESRTKEALWLKDLDLAEERARKLVERDILDPRYQLELGEVLLKQDKVEEAAQVYRSATRLGPPGTAIAWFMAGQCYQSLGELELAYDCYLACLHCDPLAISAIKRLSKLAPVLGNKNLTAWCQLRLSQLEQEKQKMVAMGSNISAYTTVNSLPKQAA